jgi:GTPase SAR1 family protein
MLNLDLKLNKKINMSIGNILVVGNVGSGKTTLLKNLAIQACDKKMKVHYLTPTIMEDIPNIQVDKVDIKQCASIVGDFYQEMMERYSEMTKRGSSSYVDLDVKPLLLIIDNLDILLQSDKYQYIDTIKNKLDSIARLGRNAGIKFIISSQTVEGIPITLREFCPHKIIVSNANSNTFEELFKTNEILQVPSGTGIYKYNNEDMVTFIINDVADY